MITSWRLDTGEQTLVLASERDRLPSVIYWGAPLPKKEDLEQLYGAYLIDLTGGMLDENPDLSICPEATRSFPGQPGMILRSKDSTPILPKFRFAEDLSSSKDELKLSFKNDEGGLVYTAEFEAFADSNIITAQSMLSADDSVHLHWLAAPIMPGPQMADEMIDFAGRWCGEFQEVRTQWHAGMRYRENRTGRTGHEHFPGLIVPVRGATNTQGEVYAFHYGWSGGHRMVAEELADGRRQIQFGHAARMETESRKDFQTSLLYLTYSDEGINGCARAFQRHARHHIVNFPDATRPRPVHYNCWEAVYFNHNLSELKEIATLAANLGAERFVLDDGWFGSRDDDTRALSEWDVDPRKYPDGLHPLVDHVHGEGMSFGIWFEPEMINPESSLYKVNPHWALGSEDQILGRHQKALNMGLSEVRDFLFERISKILKDHEIDYIKWDHNRVMPMPDATQTRGSYELIDRLREAFPNVEIESCASGGGRIDFGILQRVQRVWLSDSNDAMERARIQHGASLFLPACITGSHVGPRLCHTSGRSHSINYRAWIAAQRHMGFEMDPRELTEDETQKLIEVTTWWKQERDWLMNADILRLESPDPSVLAELHMAEDGSQFVIFANKTDTSFQIAPRPLRACRLEANAYYKVNLVNSDEIPDLSKGAPYLKSKSMCVSGRYLMGHGMTLPWSFPNQVWVIKGVRQK
jgi:alpha-galactosidase